MTNNFVIKAGTVKGPYERPFLLILQIPVECRLFNVNILYEQSLKSQ